MIAVDFNYITKWLADQTVHRKENLLARGYHAGKQAVYLTDRLKEFLQLHREAQIRLNIIQCINNALRDELSVKGFDTNEPEGAKKQEQWAQELWWKLRMDYLQNRVHETTIAEREAFVIVDYDVANKTPVFTFHRSYIEPTISIIGNTELTGDGLGCFAIYENNDIDQKMIAAVKRWAEQYQLQGGAYSTRQRMTIYYPDRIERYVQNGGGWAEYMEEGGEWPTKWVDSKGQPLGIPVIHFRNSNYIPESWEAIPLQDAINKTLIDILGTADLAGFPMFKTFGWFPTTDGKPLAADLSNQLKVEPMAFLGSQKPPSEASLEVIGAQSVEPLINTMIELILLAAQITNTPTSRFVVTKQVASADTLKEQERGLVKKAANRRVIFGDAWEDCIRMARRLANVFGGELMDEGVIFQTKWSRSESEEALENADHIQDMEQKKLVWDTLANVLQSSQGMIPAEAVLRDFGWTDKQLVDYGTQKAAAIKLQQEDTIPGTGL